MAGPVEKVEKQPEEQEKKIQPEEQKTIGKIKKAYGWVAKKLTPKEVPILTAVPDKLDLFSKKGDELLSKIKTMKKEEVAEVMLSLYKYLSTYKTTASDRGAITELLMKIGGARPDAWSLILQSNDKSAKGFVELFKGVSPTILKHSAEPLTARDAVIILNVFADAEHREGKDFSKVLASIKRRFGVEFSTSEEMWLLSNWLKSNIVDKVAIEQEVATLEARILGALGINPESKIPDAVPFLDNLRKLAEYGDPKAYLFASMKDEKYLNALEKKDGKELADIIRNAKDFDSLIIELKWGKGGLTLWQQGTTLKELEEIGKKVKYFDVGQILTKTVEDTKEDFAALKILTTDLTKQYKVPVEKITNAAKNHTPIFDGEWRKAFIKTAKSTGLKAAKFVAWPSFKMGELPPTPKGYLKKGWWVAVQLAWLAAISIGAYYGGKYVYGKIKAGSAPKLKLMEDIGKELWKRGAKPTKETLEFLVEKGAPIWTFIKSKAQIGEIYYPSDSEKAEELLVHPEKGGYYFNYPKINNFVKRVQELSEKNPKMALKKILNDNFDEFVKNGYFVPHGIAFLVKFCENFGFSAEDTKYLMTHPDEFLSLYTGVLNCTIPLSYVAVYKRDALENAKNKFKGEAIITEVNSLMDLLDKYAAMRLVSLDFFDEFAANKDVLNKFLLGKDELVYGDLPALCRNVIEHPNYATELKSKYYRPELESLYLSERLYFIGPAEIARWDLRFLRDPDAARFVMKYSGKEGGKDVGLFNWLKTNATYVKTYDLVKHLMQHENLIKTYEGDLAKLETYLTDLKNSEEGKKFRWSGKLSQTPIDIFPVGTITAIKEGKEEVKIPPELTTKSKDFLDIVDGMIDGMTEKLSKDKREKAREKVHNELLKVIADAISKSEKGDKNALPDLKNLYGIEIKDGKPDIAIEKVDKLTKKIEEIIGGS